jgi:hypothetical protein
MASMKKYGSPPYGNASEYPAARIALYMGWDPETSLKQLAGSHIVISAPDQSLADMARENDTSIGRLLDIMCTRSIGNKDNGELAGNG